PVMFSTVLGSGASGEAWLSTNRKYVIKICMNEDNAKREARFLLDCRKLGLAVATFHGLYSDGWRTGIVTSYAGSSIGRLPDAPLHQRQQLLTALSNLHQHNIHHHDIRSANVMVDDHGAVKLIDFDQAK
ncbi:kinase-like domain-containing protein, partial [Favolaschia claudopus]